MILPHTRSRATARAARNGGQDASVLIDATLKENFPPISLPKREYMENALKRSGKNSACQNSSPKSPWYGYSLGEWSDDLEHQAELAVKSEYWQTGEWCRQHKRSDVKMNTELRTLTDDPDLSGREHRARKP